MDSILLSKLLIIIPWISSIVIGLFLYFSWDVAEHKSLFLRHTVSHYGANTESNSDRYYWFATGWTLFCILTMIGVLIKISLWNQYQNVKRTPILIFNFCLITLGLLFLLMMAWFPLTTNRVPHLLGAFLGVILCGFAMLFDTINWFSLWKSVDAPNGVSGNQMLIIIYSMLLTVAISFFGLTYAFWYVYQYHTHYGQQWMGGPIIGSVPGTVFEWLLLLSILLQFLTQSMHGLTFLSRARHSKAALRAEAASSSAVKSVNSAEIVELLRD